jgi:hypothetical protein
MRRTLLALGGAAVLAVSGCAHRSHAAAPPTTSTPASTSSAPDPYVIPPVITVAYVNAVFKVLNHINGNAARSVVSVGHLTEPAIADLRSIYNDPLYGIELRVFDQSIATHFANVRRPPGDRETEVLKVLAASASCIFVESKSDLSAVQVRPSPGAASEYWQLSPKQSVSDRTNLNPTPWGLTLNEAFREPTTIASPCRD